MVGTERLLADRQRALVERLGLGVAALVLVQLRQIVQAVATSGMVGTERLLVDRQRALVERLGLGVAALVAVEHSQIVQRLRDIGMVGPSVSRGSRGLLRERYRICVLPCAT